MKIHIHNYVRDSFEESKHPRANNGQFGAGVGKGAAEHAKHHLQQAAQHRWSLKTSHSLTSAERTAHSEAAVEHEVAAKHMKWATLKLTK